ncbi:TPA: hypothetical protein ACOTG0_002704 [Clostridium perfringens]
MRSIEVTTKEQLKKAIDEKYDEIIVKGELAKKLHKSRKIKKLSRAKIGMLTAALTAGAASVPITGGLSLAVATPIAALTGLEIAFIIAVFFVGISLVIAVYNGYDDIEFSQNPLKLRLRKKLKE